MLLLIKLFYFVCLTVWDDLHVASLSYASKLNNTIERFVKFQKDGDIAFMDFTRRWLDM